MRETTFKMLLRGQSYLVMESIGLELGCLASDLGFSTYMLRDPGHVTGQSLPKFLHRKQKTYWLIASVSWDNLYVGKLSAMNE